MDLLLIIVGVLALIAGWKMPRPGGEMGSGAMLLVLGGAVILLIGVAIFSVAFVHGFGEGYRQAQQR